MYRSRKRSELKTRSVESKHPCMQSYSFHRMPIVPVNVNESCDTVFCLLDSGSSNSFVTRRLVDKLRITGSRIESKMTTLTGVSSLITESVNLVIKSVQNGKEMTLSNVIVLPELSATYSKVDLDDSEFSCFHHLPLSHIPENTKTDIMIGNDHAHLLVPINVCKDENEITQLFAI